MASHIQLLVTRLSDLPDPRQAGKVSYPLVEMALTCVAGVVADCEGWDDIAEFGRDQLEWLRQFLPFEHGVASEDTFARVFSVVNIECFERLLSQWVDEVFRQRRPPTGIALEPAGQSSPREVVPFDGKTLRRSHNRANEQAALHVVSAWASELGVSLGQLAVPEKSNEITAIPQLVTSLNLVDCIVTTDAMGCQKEIARTIREAEADYVLAVKGNQPTLLQIVAQFFEDMEQHEVAGTVFESHETLEQNHGRREHRLYWQAPAPVALTSSGEWADLQTLGMAINERTIGEQTTSETRYFISSLSCDVLEFSRAVRSHWSIENSLHWRLDVVFHEDDSRQRIGHSARAFSQIRRIALSLLNQEKTTQKSLRAKRKKAARNPDYLLKVLTGV